jgi:hypothetical protein
VLARLLFEHFLEYGLRSFAYEGLDVSLQRALAPFLSQVPTSSSNPQLPCAIRPAILQTVPDKGSLRG